VCVVEEVLAVGINLEPICAAADGQLRERGEGEAGQDPALQGVGEGPQTHIKELAGAKRVVGELPLFGAPRAVQKAVPNHGPLAYAGVDVQSQVPG
jgi:hypothetical protein